MDMAYEILRGSRIGADEKARVHNAYAARARAASAETSWRTRSCPGCGQGLKMTAFLDKTLLVCAGCSFIHEIPFLMDEARGLGETYTPGVTGKTRGNVLIGADGSVKRVW